MLREALEIHAETLESLEGESLAYSRGSLSFSPLGILTNQQADEERTFSGVQSAAKLLDVLIRPSWFEASELGEPKPGDRIQATDGRRFEVRAQQSGEPCFAWSDARQTFYRIHLIELLKA